MRIRKLTAEHRTMRMCSTTCKKRCCIALHETTLQVSMYRYYTIHTHKVGGGSKKTPSSACLRQIRLRKVGNRRCMSFDSMRSDFCAFLNHSSQAAWQLPPSGITSERSDDGCSLYQTAAGMRPGVDRGNISTSSTSRTRTGVVMVRCSSRS